jgi:SAM-dependent methyltransferase
LLNWAARYFPILRCLRKFVTNGGSILEVGCGAYGLAYFSRRELVGCDIEFSQKPSRLIRAVVALADNLPFADRSFDSVVASDVLEHVRPEQRQQVVREVFRVCRKVAIFGFPSGTAAHHIDEGLLADYQRLAIPAPKWLLEHMDNPFPDGSLFDGLSAEWEIQRLGNEHVSFHRWMMRREMRGRWNRFFGVLLACLPGLVEQALRLADREPYYRAIFVAIRNHNRQRGISLKK